MILYRREAILGHQPYLMARDNQSNSTEQHGSGKVPTSTIVVAVVLGVVGLCSLVGVALYVYRAWELRKGRLASVPVSKKKSGKDAVQMHVDLESASKAEEKDDDLELEKPKRAVLVAGADGDSPWHASVDGKSVEMDATEQDNGWLNHIKPTYGGSINTLKPPSSQEQIQSEPLHQPPRMHCTTPSFSSSEVLAMSPPPSYSVANQPGGILSRVADVEVFEEARSEIEANVRTIPVPPTPPTPLQRLRSEMPPPTPPLSSSRFVLAFPGAATPPVPSPKRTSSIGSGDTSRSPSEQGHASPSRVGNIKDNSSQSSLVRVPSNSGRSDLPRLMTVINTFIPNMDDELPIKIGETVRMLEEFKDGWCTVQYVGKVDAARGAVPRICLQERKSVVPVRKSSINSLASASSFRR